MEGVVLYVTLVKVFVHNHKYYIIGFTVASYGMYSTHFQPITIIIDKGSHYTYPYTLHNSNSSCVHDHSCVNWICSWNRQYPRQNPLLLLQWKPINSVSTLIILIHFHIYLYFILFIYNFFFILLQLLVKL